MKKLTVMLTAISFLCLMSVAIAANDKDLKEHVTFNEKIWVNNTLVKPGKYLIRYDSTMGVMKVMEGDDVVAEAKATVRVNDEKFHQDALLTTETSKGEVLTGIRLGGQHEEIQLTEMAPVVGIAEFNFDE